MLFNSYPFILLFLPITLAMYFMLARVGVSFAVGWLACASLFFYGWWNPAYLWLLLASITWNFSMGRVILSARDRGQGPARLALVAAVFGNLAVLGYYKYSGFFISNIDALLETNWHIESIILPLGISFYTFTQIAFLVDTYRGEATRYNFLNYVLFVSYFPHLLAGPILHHRDIMPQFARRQTYAPSIENISTGLVIFLIGLFKKVVLADGVAPYVAPGFEAARMGDVGFFDGWGAGLGFTMQIYFDFSGYSDMAIGVSRMFGVVIPINFNSPFQAFSITDFWQRWHITLTRFLGDYLFVPMGGRRRSPARRAGALIATMLLAGLWHGAAWTFVAFGGLHGIFILIHHNWRTWRRKAGRKRTNASALTATWSWALTMLAWIVGAVMFRADSMGTWWRMIKGMAGFNGVVLPGVWQDKLGALGHWMSQIGVSFAQVAAPESVKGLTWAIPLFIFAALLPNTQRLLSRYLTEYRKADIAEPLAFRAAFFAPRTVWAIAFGLMGCLALLRMTRISEFLYYQF